MKRAPCDSPVVDRLLFEREAHQGGFQWVAGIDEAGRGPLAGPVVAAAVILPKGTDLPGVKDSKQLKPAQRDTLYDEIVSRACSVAVGCVEASEIDRMNILQATFTAMLRAVENLSIPPDYLLIDGPYTLPTSTPHRGIPHGDRLCVSIGAASIIAKVHRDRLMCDYHQLFPVYGFDRHKGYGTAAHLETLRVHGPCGIHRLTFRGVLSNGGEDERRGSNATRQGQAG